MYALRYPTAFAHWLSAADFALGKTCQIGILYNENRAATPFIDIIRSEYRPNAIVAASNFPPPHQAPSLLMDRPLIDNQATVYVCERFVCNQPVASPKNLQEQLRSVE